MNEGEKGFLGLRTVIYGVSDLAAGKDWYTRAFGVKPYFDEPFYVGFNIGGYELGLDPNSHAVGDGGCVAYWGVTDAAGAVARMESIGASVAAPVTDVGEGIKVAAVLDPFGNRVGIIENPHFDSTKTT